MGDSRLFFVMLAAILLVSCAETALAAKLHGKIYDLELNELNDVVVTVSSEPVQRYVSKDGAYSFELNPGTYPLSAEYSPDEAHVYTAQEQVTISQDGDYVYDLFLFPDLEEDDQVIDDEIVELPENGATEKKKGNTTLIIAVIIVIILLITAYIFVGRLKKKEQKKELKEAAHMAAAVKQEHLDDDDLKKVIDIMHKEGGRTTQKELRRHIPLSEAKISLMISELEHKGIVEKVKKGRGNILILKKK
jgi:uncharacterized membrane protein